MSGQPYNSQADIKSYRKQYLDTLALVVKNDKTNLDANMLYKQTGVITQPTDTRTLQEREMDIVNMKATIRSRLLELTDGLNASQIVEELDDAELLFLANQIDNIIGELKPQFKLGIPSGAFYAYLGRFIRKFEETEGVGGGGAGAGDANSIAMLLSVMPQKADIEMLAQRIPLDLRARLSFLTRNVDIITVAIGIAGNKNIPATIRQEMADRIRGIVDDMPSGQDVRGLADDFARQAQLRDKDGLAKSTNDLRAMIAGSEQEGEFNDLEELTEQASKYGGGGSSIESTVPMYGVTTGVKTLTRASQLDSNPLLPEVKATAQMLIDRGEQLYMKNDDRISVKPSQLTKSDRDDGERNKNKVWFDYTNLRELMTDILGAGMKGKGLIKPKAKKVPKINYDEGVKADVVSYIPFGKYIIHKGKLADNVVDIRRQKGSVPIKSQRVSKSIGNVIRKVIGGSVPSYEEVNDLNPEEKDYIRRVLKASNLLDRFAIPSPSRDQDEKDLNQFEIMRGQIIAGNDNADLIR